MRERWTYKKLGEICESDLGKTLNQSKDMGDLCPYLCAINIQWDHVDLVTLKTARFSDMDKQKYSVKKGDLLVCEGGDIGRAAIWDKDGTMQYQNALHRIRFIDHTYCPRFYLAYLRYLKNKGVLDSRYGKGVTIQHLVKSSLLSIPVPVPPLPDQERIVAELDLLTGIIDKQKSQLKELDTLAQSIFYDMFGNPESNEKGWITDKFQNVCCELFAGGDVPKGHCSSLMSDEYCIPILSNGVGEKAIYGYTDKARVSQECITISGRGTIGYCEVREKPFFPVVRLIVAVPKKDTILSIFLKFVVDALHLHGVGVAIPQLTIPMVKDIPIVLPPLSLQQSFAQKIQSIESQKASINQSIAETQKLFDYTMDKYFG